MTKEYILEMNGITKVYPNGVTANKNVEFKLRYNEIHALLGENGAGKSTLMKILFGSEDPTEGEVLLKGEKVSFSSPLDAIEHRIGMVHQHFMLDETLTVAENIVLGIEPSKGIALDYSQMNKNVKEIAEKYKFNVRPEQVVGDLNVGQKQKVEILKALIRGAEILILDEPTAVLTPQETEELFLQLKVLRDEGHSIVFISHKLDEIKEICSRGTVLRNGESIGSYDLEDVTIEKLSELMVGHKVESKVDKLPAAPKETILKIRNLNVRDSEDSVVVDNVSFDVRKGEILGIAGVEGNGQRELIDSITGLNENYQGEIKIHDTVVAKENGVMNRRRLNMNHIPEDRLTLGGMADGTIEENLIANRFKRKDFNRRGMLNQDKINAFSQEMIRSFQIKTDSEKTPIRMLSGGNMQKVVAAREMTGEVDILIADQPTRGIDVGAAKFIHEQLVGMRDNDTAILLSSADINEVLNVSDSLIVFYNGKISAYFKDASEVTENELGLYMLGIKSMSEEEIRGVTYE